MPSAQLYCVTSHMPRSDWSIFKLIAWMAINKALQNLQTIWLIGLGLGEGEILEEIQSVSQFVLEDSRTFRT